MTSRLAKYNLDRDKKVLGKEWLLTYGNYFSDEDNIQLFISAVKPFLPNKELDILYVASASGLLGERLLANLGKANLTIVDISQKHLDENKNPKTKRFCLDLLDMDLGKKFDLIIMRSALDYFPSEELQITVLKIIKRHLKSEGLFINQPAYISDVVERNLVSLMYNTVNKIGKRLFQSSDLESIYLNAGFNFFEKIGGGKILNLTEQDHIKRYGLTGDDIGLGQEILKDCKNSARVTKKGYNLKFEFPIFLAK